MFIAEWEWDDDLVDHLARHRVRPSDVLDVWAESPKYRRNKKGRAASHQMIGPDRGGAFFAVFIREVDPDEGRWRVITARRASDAEQDWWGLS